VRTISSFSACSRTPIRSNLSWVRRFIYCSKITANFVFHCGRGHTYHGECLAICTLTRISGEPCSSPDSCESLMDSNAFDVVSGILRRHIDHVEGRAVR
jgi:hypothetical protein